MKVQFCRIVVAIVYSTDRKSYVGLGLVHNYYSGPPVKWCWGRLLYQSLIHLSWVPSEECLDDQLNLNLTVPLTSDLAKRQETAALILQHIYIIV